MVYVPRGRFENTTAKGTDTAPSLLLSNAKNVDPAFAGGRIGVPVTGHPPPVQRARAERLTTNPPSAMLDWASTTALTYTGPEHGCVSVVERAVWVCDKSDSPRSPSSL